MTNRYILAVLALLLLPALLTAQETRGSIVGRVLDSSGAVIPGVSVRATNTATNVTVSTQSNAQGNYDLPYLLPGAYRLTAEQAGFKTFSREGIELRISERISIDIPMEVGAVSEQVTVTAETPLLESATANINQVIDQRRVAELPMAHGNPYLLISLSPGVAHTQNIALDQPWAPTHIVGYTMGGVRANRSEITLDGTPNTVVNHRWGQGDLMSGSTPPADVVQELKVETSTFDAAVGHTQGGMTSITLKSGANTPHGTTYYSLLNPVLDSNLFFANQGGQPKAPYHYHRWGLSFTGPVWLPKVYNGKNRTFFTYGYEGIRDSRPRGTFLTVPTASEREGDFSALLKIGPQYQIYDPMTRVAIAGGRYQEQPISGNLIPRNRISPVAQKILSYWPLPNTPGTADGLNNFNATNEPEALRYYNHIFRLDHNFSEKHRAYLRMNTYKRTSFYYDYFHTDATGGDNNWPQHAISLDDVYHFSPATFLNVRYAFYRLDISLTPKSMNFDLGQLGLPKSYTDLIPKGVWAFPYISIGDYSSSYDGWYSHIHANHNLEAHLTSIHGNHSLRMGGDARQYRTYHVEPSNRSTGYFSFGNTYTRGPLDNSPGAPKGQGLASMLLGLATGGGVDRNASYAEQSTEYSWYFQDDWKVTSKLTVNVGIRYEIETPLTERFNRTVRGYDFKTPNPFEEAARANYAKKPIAELPPDQFRFIGGLTFPGVGGQPRTLWNIDRNNFMPRIGFAYTMNNKTVFRGGYGMFYGPLGARRVDVRQDGFSLSTPLIASLDSGLTFIATLANPFPSGVQEPPGAADGLKTFAGRSIGFFAENPLAPLQQRWSLSVQHELPRRFLIEVGYVGNHGGSMETGIDYRPLPLKYLSTKPYRDVANLNYLSESVANPFYGLLPGTSLSGQNTSRAYLLSSGNYTGFTGMSSTENVGYSWYHSLITKVERRFSAGWTLNVAYTWSKNMEATGRLNGYLDRLEYVVSDQDRPHRIVVSGIWELPFGPGKKFANSNPFAGKVLGGWQVSGIYTGQGGQAMGFGDVFFSGDIHNIPLPVSQQRVDRWFNIDAGFVRSSQEQPTYHYRTMASRFNNIRGDGVNLWDISTLKNTKVNERVNVQFRAEFLNTFNHPNFNNPATGVTSTLFGKVTSQKGYPRRIQLGLKILF